MRRGDRRTALGRIGVFTNAVDRQQHDDIAMSESDTVTRESVADARQNQMTADASAEPRPTSQDGSDDHAVNIRLTIPLFVKSYYITLLVGPERRSPERRAEERRKHPLLTIGNVSAMMVLGLCLWLYFRMLWSSVTAIAN